MTATGDLARRLRRTILGPMWHGPAFDELLAEVDPLDAASRPVAGAHTIWELVLHSAAWAEIARARIEGRELDYPRQDRDWPPQPPDPDAAQWAAARERLQAAYSALATRVERIAAADLDEPVEGQEHSMRIMLQGVVEHGAYHAGQVALLKRALAEPRLGPDRLMD